MCCCRAFLPRGSPDLGALSVWRTASALVAPPPPDTPGPAHKAMIVATFLTTTALPKAPRANEAVCCPL